MFKKSRKHLLKRQSGNAVVAMFGAVAVLGLLGVGYTNLIKGPAQNVNEITNRTESETEIFNTAKLILSATTQNQTGDGDCDNDKFIEPLPWRTAGGLAAPTGGGLLPTGTQARTKDAWKTEIGYCVWDHGPVNAHAGCGGASALRLKGANLKTEPALVIISAGANRTFQTTCNAFADTNADNVPDVPLLARATGSDDLIISFTYGELAATGVSGGNLKELPDEACTPDQEGILRYSMDTVQICRADGWHEVGSEITPSTGFLPITNAPLNQQYTSNEITFSGFFGSRPASVDNGGTIIVNDIAVGSTANINAGDRVRIRGNAAAAPETTIAYVLKVSSVARPFNITSRNKTPVSLSISPSSKTDMHVTRSGGTESYGTGSAIGIFTVTNTGETKTSYFNAATLSNTTNFEFYNSTPTYYGDYCQGRALDYNQTCTISVRPKATTNGTPSATLSVSTLAPAVYTASATLSGTASGWGCALPWGGTLAHSGSVTAYLYSSHGTCPSETRNCNQPTLSGSYTYQSCTIIDACSGSPAIGTVCANGSTYAGITSDGNIRMYTTNASYQIIKTWSNGGPAQTDTPAVNCSSFTPGSSTGCYQGETNTSVVSSFNDAYSPYLATKYCQDLVVHGQSDWYLPSQDELSILRTNRVAIGGFDVSGVYPGGRYWSSTERGPVFPVNQRFSDGQQNVGFGKDQTLNVRCIRK